MERKFNPFSPIAAIFEIQSKKGEKGPLSFVASSITFFALFVSVAPLLRAERVTKTTAVIAPAMAITTPDKTNKFLRAHRLNFSSQTKSLALKSGNSTLSVSLL